MLRELIFGSSLYNFLIRVFVCIRLCVDRVSIFAYFVFKIAMRLFSHIVMDVITRVNFMAHCFVFKE
jgi:hypothetical protein